MIFRGVFCLFLVVIIDTVSFGQSLQSHRLDSLQKFTFSHLQEAFFVNEIEHPEIALLIAQGYLIRAKKRQDSIKIAHGYKFLSYMSEKDDALKYSDSIIYITEKSNHISFPTLGYLLKGYYYYQAGDYQEALESYLSAYPYAVEKKNFEDQIQVQGIIASLKNRWGKYDEALSIYRDVLMKLKEDGRYEDKYKKLYTQTLYNISLAYIRNNNSDSASVTIQRGREDTRKRGDTLLNNSFTFIAGINAFKMNKYELALDNIDASIPYLDNKTSKAIAYYYRGRIFEKKKMEEKCLKNYIKVDSLFKETQDEFPELPNAYKFLIHYHKTNNNLHQQLYYINRLLYVDSIIHKNQINLNSIITKEYDTPKLISEKENIIADLHTNKKYSRIYTIGLISLGLVLFIAFVRSRIRNKELQNKFDALIENKNAGVVNDVVEHVDKEINKKSDIPESIIEEILDKLYHFELNEGYLDKDISINLLSKSIKTNQNYLSRVINFKKEKNFSSYINDLRIDYVVARLKSDKKLLLYSLSAIAEEAGYKKYPPFLKAFVKRTGLKPSYFINKLKERQG